MNRTFSSLAVVVALAMAGCGERSPTEVTRELAPASPQAARGQTGQTLIEAVTGTIGTLGSFTGTAQITGFAVDQAGNLSVTGVLNGVATVGGVATQIVNQAFTTTATLTGSAQQGSCDILFLDVGAIHLDLLGLNVDLSRIVLDVSAVAGAGNLLGNLLCAVVHLLDNPLQHLQAILQLINQINAILGSV